MAEILHPGRTVSSRRLICVGSFAGAFGVHGLVRIRSFCGAPADIAEYQPLFDEHGMREFSFQLVRSPAAQLVAKVGGVATREQAQQLKGVGLYADRSRFPPAEPGEFYHADLIGMQAVDGGGRLLGTVKAVVNHGAGDLLAVTGGKAGDLQIPFTRSAVPSVDLAGRQVLIDWHESGE